MKKSIKTSTLVFRTLLIAVMVILIGWSMIFRIRSGNAEGLYGTFFALVPPIIAITLALLTKEVYSSLFIGILLAGLYASGFAPVAALDTIVGDGLTAAVSDNAGIFIFLVILGIMVSLVTMSGASQAFGEWAETHIKTRTGAMLATMALGVLIFIDDYFNCLTVGSVMKPVCEKHKISRQKMAYIIDATAAPICMIAPVSSWAAAVSSYAEGTELSGIELFIRAIPYNFYSILTIVFMITLIVTKFDFGPMKKFETAAMNAEVSGEAVGTVKGNGAKVIDLLLPIIVLILTCVIGLLYVGGFFDGAGFIDAFGDTDAFVGLPWGSLIALLFTIVFLLIRKRITFSQAMSAIPDGFIKMVPAILILTMATSLKNITGILGGREFVAGLTQGAADSLISMLPAVIFAIAVALSFATGTSWGTFGILIPIVIGVFDASNPLFIISISACLAGAVCGDHCSPISDTTIMSSAGADCPHLDHVSTQIPYAITVAVISCIFYILAGLVKSMIIIPISIIVTILLVIGLKYMLGKSEA